MFTETYYTKKDLRIRTRIMSNFDITDGRKVKQTVINTSGLIPGGLFLVFLLHRIGSKYDGPTGIVLFFAAH